MEALNAIHPQQSNTMDAP